MSNKKKRVGNKELRYLRRIDRLLDNHEQEIKENNQSSNEEKVEVKSASPSLNWIDKIVLTPHSTKRAKERFGLEKNADIKHFRSLLRKAREIGISVAEDGGEAILFAIGRCAIYVSLDYKEIKTVRRQETVTYEPIKNLVAEIHAKELRKLTRKENACKRKLHETKLEVKLEIAQLELRMHRTKSIAVKNACQARINALNIHMKEKEDEIQKIYDLKRRISKSMVAVV